MLEYDSDQLVATPVARAVSAAPRSHPRAPTRRCVDGAGDAGTAYGERYPRHDLDPDERRALAYWSTCMDPIIDDAPDVAGHVEPLAQQPQHCDANDGNASCASPRCTTVPWLDRRSVVLVLPPQPQHGAPSSQEDEEVPTQPRACVLAPLVPVYAPEQPTTHAHGHGVVDANDGDAGVHWGDHNADVRADDGGAHRPDDDPVLDALSPFEQRVLRDLADARSDDERLWLLSLLTPALQALLRVNFCYA